MRPLKLITSPLPHNLLWAAGTGRGGGWEGEICVVYNYPGNFLKPADLEQPCMYQGHIQIEVKCVV